MMLTKTRKSKITFLRLTSLALLVVVAITLLVACGGGGGGNNNPPPSDGSYDEMTLTPIVVTIPTPPPNTGMQVIEYLDDGGGNGKYQNMEFDVSGVPEFNGIASTDRIYKAISSVPDVATVIVDSRTGMTTVDVKKQGTAIITVTVTAAASSTLTRSVSAPATRQDTAEYSFTVQSKNSGPKVVIEIDDQTANQDAPFRFTFAKEAFEDKEDYYDLDYAHSMKPNVSWLAFDKNTRTFSGTPDGANPSIIVTVSASDGEYDVTDDFTISVNRLPTVVTPIDAMDLTVGYPAEIRDVAAHFTDPDGGVLTYTVSSDAPGVATADVSESVVTVTPVAAGSATITVTAENPARLRVSQTFEAKVAVNQSPMAVGTIPAVTLAVGGSPVPIGVATYFNDSESGVLSYTVSSSAPGVATADVSGSVVTVTPVTTGNATLTVTAHDLGGLSATQDIAVTVTAVNQPPTAVGTIPAVTLAVGDSAVPRDVASNFNDPEGGVLSYTVSSSAPGVAIASVSGSIVTVTPIAAGNATITVTAQDPGGLSATQDIAVTVEAVTVGVPLTPDLIIPSSSVSSYTVGTGESFTFSATVLNQGSGEASRTTLRYHRSTDSEFSSYVLDDTDSVRVLPASKTRKVYDRLTAPDSTGTYYYRACVDSVLGESNTDNNCSTVFTVTVEPSDLIISSSSVSSYTVVTDAAFTFSATVLNQGSGRSPSTDLIYHRSTDSRFSSYDRDDDNYVSSLSVSETSEEYEKLYAPDSAGTYYYRACVDSVPGESNIDNNCSTVFTVTVVAQPDLIISSKSVSDSTVRINDFFTFNATVRNRGNGEASRTTLRYYRSTNSIEHEEDSDRVRALSASDTSDQDASLDARVVGTHYYRACVDSVPGESDTTNNCSTAVRVTVEGLPDLIISSISVSDSTVTIGDSPSLYATVRNQGSGSSSKTTLKFYRSTDSMISRTDTEVGTSTTVKSLSASRTRDRSTSLSGTPSTAGTYYYGACVDSVPYESNTDNNCSTGIKVIVEASPSPDLIISSLSIESSAALSSNSDDTVIVVRTGDSFTLRATVRNQGSGRSSPTTLRYELTSDQGSSYDQIEDATKEIDALSASRERQIYVGLRSITVGEYLLRACVDSVSGESNTDNNCSNHVALGVVQ